jgi:hypothetical protein
MKVKREQKIAPDPEPKKVGCNNHGIDPASEHWKVVLEELEGEEDINFRGQVCPACFLMLKDRLVQAARNLRIESRQNIALRAEADQLRQVVDAVVVALKELTGEDAYELATKAYKPSVAAPVYDVEQGKLVRIIPNLIVEAANTKKKSR